MIKNLIITLFLFTLIIACNEKVAEPKQNETIEYYSDNPKLVFKKAIHINDYDSVYYFYKNGKLFKKGKQYEENQKIGKWHLYKDNGNLAEIREWVKVNDTNYINRVWHLENGDTLSQRYKPITTQEEFLSDTLGFRHTTFNIFKYLSSDTITMEEPFSAYVYYGTPILRNYNSEIKVFLEKENGMSGEEFIDSEEMEYQIFPAVKDDSINRQFFGDYQQQYVAVFGRWYNKPGKKLIKGYVLEYAKGPFNEQPIPKKDVDCLLTKTYFEKMIFVKE